MKRKQTLKEGGVVTRSKRVKIVRDISDLPIDVMILIFKLLTPSERRNAMLVSSSWLDLENTYFYKDHHLILTSDMDFSPGGMLYQTFLDRQKLSKDLRSFSQLTIKSFPNTIESLMNIPKFLKLLEDDVKSLVIDDSPVYIALRKPIGWYNNCVYAKLPKLENLEVQNLMYLRALDAPPNLKSIKVNSSMRELGVLSHCQGIKTIKSLTVKWFEVAKEDMENDLLLSLVEPDVQENLQQILSSENQESILLHSNFNFCESKKLALQDVTGITIRNLANPISPKILSSFKNLKRLTCVSYIGERPLILAKERVQYSGITHLQINGLFTPEAPYFDMLLKSFPDLEHLTITNNDLKDNHFALICQYMPKLKELSLENSFSKISIVALLARDTYSLKDLKFLERLTIETKYEILNGTTLQWPTLPHLTELNLIGRGFRSFAQRFYTQIAINSPNITRFSIDYNHFQVVRNRFVKFLPLIRHLKLTHLSLPGEGNGNAMNDPNSELVSTIIRHGNQLQELYIKDGIGFLLPQELRLFSSIPSLQKISSIVLSNSLGEIERVITRKDLKDIKNYLSHNLGTYKRLDDTLEYIIENIIPANVLRMLEIEFQAEYGDSDPDFDESSNLYMVAGGFLQMKFYDLCKLVMNNLNSE